MTKTSRKNATYARDPRVDAYIDALPAWQRAICREVRDLVHGADRELVETVKRTKLPYFVLEGNVCALLAAKDHVNVFLYDGGIVPDPEGIITGGHGNKTARTVAIREGEAIRVRALMGIIKRIIANNRAGGWRRVKNETLRRPSEMEPRVRRLLDSLRVDRRLAPVVVAFLKDASRPGRSFGKNGLKTRDGKLFALFTQGTLVVKLPKDRVVALVEEGVGKPFDPGQGRLMKEWLTITSPKASWVELAREAFAFVERR